MSKTATLPTESLPVADLVRMGAPYNPRTISDADLAALRRSLRYFGIVEPVVANKRTNRIVGGHQRLKAAQAEGIEDFPVVWVDLDEPSEKQLNVALNKISGEFDETALAALLRDLEAEGADLTLTGFSDDKINYFSHLLIRELDKREDLDFNVEGNQVRLSIKEALIELVQTESYGPIHVKARGG